MSEFLPAALELVARGIPVFPLLPGQKQPLTAHGFKDATTDVGQVCAWWGTEPQANIGVPTGRGMFVLDLDSYEARVAVEAAGVVIPPDAPVVTTGKGAHVYLAGVAPSKSNVLPKVDVRGEGGYVVVPPSIHPSGARYTWAVPLPADGKLPAAPPALMAMLTNTAKLTTALVTVGDWVTEALAGVAEGGRDQACTRLAGYLLGKGVSVEATEVILQAWADRCTPPFPAAQVTKCVESIAKREGGPELPDGLPPRASDLVADTMRLIEQGPSRVVFSTGFGVLDKLLDGGFEPGTTTILGGRQGTGKTALMLQVATHLARKGMGALVLSREMGATRLMRRVLSQMAQVRFKNLKTGQLVDAERGRLALAIAELTALPLWIEARPPVRTVEALDEVYRRYEPGQVGIVFVDYLQKLRAPGGGDKREAVEHISEALTSFALEHNVAVVAASSLVKPPRNASNYRASADDLRETGQIAFDGDNILLLHREIGSEVLDVKLDKQRDGETGSVTLHYQGDMLTFREAA